MNQKFICCLVVAAGTLLLTATNGFSFGSFGNDVNSLCAPAAPYTGSCALCHVGDEANPTPAKDAYLAGGSTLTSFFCPPAVPPPPPVPTCTDNDGDTYAVEGGVCGPVDCNDSNATINPAMTENCTDNIDNNCNGLVDIQDPAAVNCDTSIIDGDGDGFTPAAGDCDDTNGTINPGAVEICTDGIDNDCNLLVDTLDPNAVNCPVNCTDIDGDGYSVEGGACGPVDCNDVDGVINPGMSETCRDTFDNDCDGNIDEGCNLTCPEGARLVIKSVAWDRADRKKLTIIGRSFVEGQSALGTTITIIDADTGTILKDAFEVRNQGGRWKAVIKRVRPTLRHITIVSSNGCSQEETIRRYIYQ
jgi:hypothetical protein